MAQSKEIEVFRLTPEVGKYYQTTTWTRITGKYPKEKYYSTNELRYVGLFIRHVSKGYHDNAQHWDIFNNHGVEEIVHYTYEGTTSFVEVDPKIKGDIKTELVHTINNSGIPSLKDLAKRQLSSEETRIANELELF